MNIDKENNSVWKLLEDLKPKKDISEIIINNTQNVFIERKSELIELNVELKAEDIVSFCKEVAFLNQSKFGVNNPILDGVLDDGSRINIISSTYTGGAPAITIRKYLKNIKNFDVLNGKFGLSEKWIQFFKAITQSKMNTIISGGTGKGKTTFLNLMMHEVNSKERLITIEDTKELDFVHTNSVRLFAQKNILKVDKPLTTRDLVKNTLRMRPDRIIIGEVRGEEAFDLLMAMNTGHDGSMCTVHSNSPAECLSRLETLFLFAGYDIPLKAVRSQMCSAIDFIVQLEKDRNGMRKVAKVTEVTNMEGDTILLQDIGNWDEDENLEFTGLVPKRINSLMSHGLSSDFFIDL